MQLTSADKKCNTILKSIIITYYTFVNIRVLNGAFNCNHNAFFFTA